MTAKGATLTVVAGQEQALLHLLGSRHSVENGFIVAPFFFTPTALSVAAECRVAVGILWFYALFSAVYFLNDSLCRPGVIPTAWVIVCTGLLARFLALSKRRADVVNGLGNPNRQSFRILEPDSTYPHFDAYRPRLECTTVKRLIYG